MSAININDPLEGGRKRGRKRGGREEEGREEKEGGRYFRQAMMR